MIKKRRTFRPSPPTPESVAAKRARDQADTAFIRQLASETLAKMDAHITRDSPIRFLMPWARRPLIERLHVALRAIGDSRP